MAGELWRAVFQMGKETTAGTRVAATRKMYFSPDSRLAYEREARPHRFAIGSRENVRAITMGPSMVSGTLKQPLSAVEVIELLLIGFKGAVTPTGAGTTKLWTFLPGTALDAATIEWDDGARAWEAGGCHANKLKFSGNASGENTVEAEIFGMNMVTTTLTGALAERDLSFMEGWESKLWIDALGDTPGTTQVTGTLINWEVEIDNQLNRKYFASNSSDAAALSIGEIGVKAKLTFEASNAAAATAFTDWNAVTEKLVRLDFGNNVVVDGSDKEFVRIDVPGAWEAIDLGGSDAGTRTYELGLQYMYDTANAFGAQILVQNARATAW